MIDVKREEVVTYTIQLSKDRASQLEDWLNWALFIWSSIQMDKNKEKEIFPADKPGWVPETNRLNHDTALLLRNKLKD